MASVKYFTKGDQTPTTIYIRFLHGRKIDIKRSTSLVIEKRYWNNKTGTVKQISSFNEKKTLQNTLNSLKSEILNKFNDHYTKGIIINGDWLTGIIKKHFDQDNKTDLNYFLDYAKYFKENLNNKVQQTGATGVTENTLKRYNTIINKFGAFETFKKKRYTFEKINLQFYKDFKHFLINVENLNLNTTGRYINYIKTICSDAKKYGIKIHPDVLNGEFRAPKEKVNFITLSEKEILTIFNHDFSHTPYLDNARNWLIIGVWTGARVSDLLNFTTKNIKNGFIEYTAKKTGQKIILPLHPQVLQILENLNGQFPRKIASQNFNNFIKIVCKEAKINQLAYGSKKIDINNQDQAATVKKKKPSKWRKISGEFKKHDLVSSHICRRSFATNHYGKLPTPVIMAVTGHKTEKMFLNYIGKTASDNAETLKNFWNLQEQKREQTKPEFQVIKTGS